MLHRYLVPEFRKVTQVLMAWADYYISMRGVAPTLVDLGRAHLEYAAPHHPKTNSDHWCTLVLADDHSIAQVRAMVQVPEDGTVAR